MRRTRTRTMLLALAIVALAGGCKIEEDLHLEADGSGEYRVRMTLQKMLGGAPQVRQALIANGFEILEESVTHDSNLITARRTFEHVGEIDELHGSLEVEDRGWLRRSYRLKLRVDDVQGQATERTFRVHLPVGIEETSAGRLDGKTLVAQGDRSPVGERPRCPSCGEPRAAGAFCTHCGAAALAPETD
jgi:hypothetical protein